MIKIIIKISENVKSEDRDILEAVVMALTYILTHLGESPLPGFVQKLLKEVSSSTKSEVLQRLGNSISWSQANFTEISNPQLVPYVVQGAKNGNMAVKVSLKFYLKGRIEFSEKHYLQTNRFEQLI